MASNNNWKRILKTFNSKDRIDTFKIGCSSYVHRGELPKTKETLTNTLKSKPPKTLNEFNHIALTDPWTSDCLQGFNKSSVQEWIYKMANTFRYFGNIALSCPCGSGKTLAGISLIAKLGVQTLIISTRCAINDQWRNTLLKIYKSDTLIKTNEGYFTYSNKRNKYIRLNNKQFAKLNKHVDVYIYSPQYLTYNNEIDKRWPVSVGLVIYDEIHSQLSSDYGKVLLQPYANVIENKTSELPCLLGLSATYPANGEYNDIITKIFGTILTNKSVITNTPIYYYDLRDEYHLKHKDVFDNNYEPVDDYEFITSMLNNEYEYYNNNIEPTIIKETSLCGFVITTSIKSSVYAWLMFYKKYPSKRCLLIRDNDSGVYALTSKPPDDIYEIGPLVEFTDIVKHPKFNEFCIKRDDYNHGDILVGTYHRLKEGISVENAVWAVCCKFLWSISTRVQLLGRIRRMSNNEYVNKFTRHFFTVSGKIPTNKGKIMAWGKYHKGKQPMKLKLEYDLDLETMVFSNENYIKVSHCSTNDGSTSSFVPPIVDKEESNNDIN